MKEGSRSALSGLPVHLLAAAATRAGCVIAFALALTPLAGGGGGRAAAAPSQKADGSAPAQRERLSVRPRTLLTVRRTIAAVFVAGTRVAFYEYNISCAKAPRCNSDTVDLWSRSSRRLRRYRDPCPGDEWIVISDAVVYWECDELLLDYQRTRIFAGLPGRKKPLLVAKSDNTMSLDGDGQQAFFSEGGRLWRLDGPRRRVILEGTSADGEILDVDSGRILFQRYDDGRLVLLDRTGSVLHLFSSRFRCCITEIYVLSGNRLMRESDTGALEIYDVTSETLLQNVDLEPAATAWVPTLRDVKHRFALHGVEQSGFRILNMATRQDTLIRMRGNDFEGSATLGPDGVYYAEQLRGRGRIQLVTYAQLRGP